MLCDCMYHAESTGCRPEQSQAAEAEADLPAWLRAELPGPPRRQGLPKPQQQEKSVSLWAIIKVCCTSVAYP